MRMPEPNNFRPPNREKGDIVNQKQKDKAAQRKPIELELKKLSSKFGLDITMSAIRHFSKVVTTEKQTQKKIAALQKELNKLKS